MKSKSLRAFQPSVFRLETRAVPSSVRASLSHGVLTITRDDASLPIQVDVLTLSVKKHGKPGHPASVVVEGVAQFDLRRVKSIIINPGTNNANIVVNEPPRARIPYTIRAVSILPPVVVSPPPANGGVVVPGVTGVQSAIEQQIFDLINVQRVQNNISPLTANSKLVTAAQIHSRDMAALDLMEHTLPGVSQPTLVSRAVFVGYQYSWLGENIASFFPDAQSLVNAWMASAPHRANILNAQFTMAGIGVGSDTSGNLFFTQEFGAPA